MVKNYSLKNAFRALDDIQDEVIETSIVITGPLNEGFLKEDNDISNANVRVFDINWETDGEDVELPSEMYLELDDDMLDENKEVLEEIIANKLSDETGCLVNSFNYEPANEEKLSESKKQLKEETFSLSNDDGLKEIEEFKAEEHNEEPVLTVVDTNADDIDEVANNEDVAGSFLFTCDKCGEKVFRTLDDLKTVGYERLDDTEKSQFKLKNKDSNDGEFYRCSKCGGEIFNGNQQIVLADVDNAVEGNESVDVEETSVAEEPLETLGNTSEEEVSEEDIVIEESISKPFSINNLSEELKLNEDFTEKEIVDVTDEKELRYLYDNWAMTWEGLRTEDFQLALQYAGKDNSAKGYLISGKLMNKICHLTGDNAYPDDLNIFAVYPFKGLAIQYGARWMYDIINNNAEREGYHPFTRNHKIEEGFKKIEDGQTFWSKDGEEWEECTEEEFAECGYEDLTEPSDNVLTEGVSQDNPYLKAGIKKWLGEDPNAKGLVVSATVQHVTDDGHRNYEEVEINQTYHTDQELRNILDKKAKELGLKGESSFYDVSALHDKSLLPYYPVYKEVVNELNNLSASENDSQVKEKEPVEQKKVDEPARQKAAQLSKKIIKAFKDSGLGTDELIVKNGVGKTKASAKLKKLKHNLFGENLEEDFEEELDILPVDTDEVELPEEDIDEYDNVEITDIDDTSLDEAISKKLSKMFENFASYKTETAFLKDVDNMIVLEGKMTFTSNKEQNTKFILEAIESDNGVISFKVVNEDFKDINITLNTVLNEGMLKAQSLESSTEDDKEQEVPETHEGQMEFLKKDEDEAIVGYEEVIEKTDNEHLADQLKHIRDEEVAHKEFLEKAKEDPNATYEHEDEESGEELEEASSVEKKATKMQKAGLTESDDEWKSPEDCATFEEYCENEPDYISNARYEIDRGLLDAENIEDDDAVDYAGDPDNYIGSVITRAAWGAQGNEAECKLALEWAEREYPGKVKVIRKYLA